DILPAWAIPNANLKTPAYPPLAREVVRYAGEAVAVVVAESPFIAENARDLVEVEYDPLPVVTDVESAPKPGRAPLHGDAPDNVAFKWILAGGDVDKVFQEADVVVNQRFVNQRLQPTAMEPRAAIAQFEPGTRELTLHVTSQNPFVHRLVLSIVLKYPEHLIHVIAPDVGGGLGSKIPVYPWEAIVCHLAMRLGRPVKWVEDRMENYVATTHGRDHVQYVDLAAKKDGTILGIRARVLANLGAYLSTAAPGIPTILFGFMVGGCYAIQAGRVEVTGVFTNTTPVDAYRGAGRPEALFLLERIVGLHGAAPSHGKGDRLHGRPPARSGRGDHVRSDRRRGAWTAGGGCRCRPRRHKAHAVRPGDVWEPYDCGGGRLDSVVRPQGEGQ